MGARELRPFVDLTPDGTIPGTWETDDGGFTDFRPAAIPADIQTEADAPKASPAPEPADDRPKVSLVRPDVKKDEQQD